MSIRRCPLFLTFAPLPLILAGLFLPSPALAALFSEATANLGAPQPCADSKEGCYSNYVVMADLEGDGDLDLVFANGGGYYEPGTTAPLAMYVNDGKGLFSEQGDFALDGFEGRLRQVALGDVDGDGDLDLYAPDSYAMQPDALFIQVSANPLIFQDQGATRLPVSSRAGATRFGDLDNDGDLDLVVTDWGAAPPSSPGTAHIYLNDGHGYFHEKAGAVQPDTSAQGTGPIDVDLFDADGDFDLDLILASRQGNSLLFLNDGAGAFTNAALPAQPGPYVYGPDECDVDGDGDLDLWLDNGSAGKREQLLINGGDGTFRDETGTRVSGRNNLLADDNEVQCLDSDGDGDFDALVASLSGNERILNNGGKGRFTLDDADFPTVKDSTLGLDLGDVNGDGRLDAVTAQGENGNFLNRLYLGIDPQKPDTRPPGFRKVELPRDGVSPGPVAIRFAVYDNATSDVGPRLRQASIQVNGGAVTQARFQGGDLYRAVLNVAAGATVRYKACATDYAGNQGCSPEQTFTVGKALRASGSTSRY